MRKLDAGRWFSPDFSGETIPTVEEVFSLLAAHREKDVLVAVDIKAADPQVETDLVGLASRHKVLDRLAFIGRAIDDPAVRRRLKAADGGARVARLVGRAEDFDGTLTDPASDWLYVRFLPTIRDVRRAQEAGKRLFLAGPLSAGHEPAHWRAAAAVGLDALLTDFPLELRREASGRRASDSGPVR